MKIPKFFIPLILFAPALLLAEGENHVAVGSRPISEEAAAQIQAEKGPQATVEDEKETPETAGFLFDLYPPIYYSNAHHWIVAITILESGQYTLELEDGSVWKIHGYDGVKVRDTWREKDPLTITQNHRWCSKYDYRIINQNNHTSAEVNLFLGPVEMGPYSRYIISIDHSRKELMLNDNTHWDLSYLDASHFAQWLPGHYVILGTNSNTSLWDSNSDALLINVNMLTPVRANQF